MKTNEEKIVVASTIIRQMGGKNLLNLMVGAHDIYATDKGVQFGFKGSKKANKVVIELNDLDLYDIKFYKIPALRAGKNGFDIDKFNALVEKAKTPVETIEGSYNDMLIQVFEKVTGLYLHF